MEQMGSYYINQGLLFISFFDMCISSLAIRDHGLTEVQIIKSI
jgi:hypothetical protein